MTAVTTQERAGLVVLALGVLTLAGGAEPSAAKPTAEAFVPAKADEPLAKTFSLEAAARALDASALHWQKQNHCCQSPAPDALRYLLMQIGASM